MSAEQSYALGSFFGPGREDMTSYTPHARHLGMKVVETGPGFAVIMLPYRPELIGDPVRRARSASATRSLAATSTSASVFACSMGASTW